MCVLLAVPLTTCTNFIFFKFLCVKMGLLSAKKSTLL